MADASNSSRSTNDVPNGYRLEPDGVLEIGTIDRPVEIPDWYRQWCERSFDKLVVRSNGKTITRSPDGLILTPEERATPLAPYHYFDDDDILSFAGFPHERKLVNQLRAIFRKLFASKQSRVEHEREGLNIPRWYETACYRQGNYVTYNLRGERRFIIIDYDVSE